MRTINNPFSQHTGYHCVGCDPQHPSGLKLRFYETGEGLVARWLPDPGFQGYPDILHGGIQATLLDEIASWLVYVKLETSGVTQKMEVQYLKPVRISHGYIYLNAILKERGDREAVIEAAIRNGEGETCARALLTYFIYPKEIAVKRMNYPGAEVFRGAEVSDFE
ncbi:MAG: PaaI family thioesterase [Bacteroidota bacterium]